jgi:hypothetical protein
LSSGRMPPSGRKDLARRLRRTAIDARAAQ